MKQNKRKLQYSEALDNGTDHNHSKSCCDQRSPARRTINQILLEIVILNIVDMQLQKDFDPLYIIQKINLLHNVCHSSEVDGELLCYDWQKLISLVVAK